MLELFLAFLAILLLSISSIFAFWGPLKLLIVSGVSGLLFGILMGLLTRPNITDGLLTGLFWGCIFSIFVVLSGIKVRHDKKVGAAILNSFFKKKDK